MFTTNLSDKTQNYLISNRISEPSFAILIASLIFISISMSFTFFTSDMTASALSGNLMVIPSSMASFNPSLRHLPLSWQISPSSYFAPEPRAISIPCCQNCCAFPESPVIFPAWSPVWQFWWMTTLPGDRTQMLLQKNQQIDILIKNQKVNMEICHES